MRTGRRSSHACGQAEYALHVRRRSDMASSAQSVALARENEQIYAAVGVHPHDAEELHARRMCRQLTALADAGETKVKALGEIGLDYYYDLSPREVQKDGV